MKAHSQPPPRTSRLSVARSQRALKSNSPPIRKTHLEPAVYEDEDLMAQEEQEERLARKDAEEDEGDVPHQIGLAHKQYQESTNSYSTDKQ